MHPHARYLMLLVAAAGVVFPTAHLPASEQAGGPRPTLLDSSALPSPAAADSLATNGSVAPSPATANVSFTEYWDGRGPEDYVGAEIGVIGLVRQKPNSQILAFDRSFNVLLDANELQGDMQFGLSTKVNLYQVSTALGGTDLQLGYWGINSMDATRTLSADQVRTIFFQRTTADVLTTMNYIYSSNLYSGEANLRMRNSARLRPIVGVRYLKLEDTFDQFNFQSTGTIGFSSLTNNSLIGGQLGLEGTLLRYRSWDWFANGRYGAMHNRVEGSAQAALAGSPLTKNYSDSSYCSLVEGETGLAFQFVQGLQFRAAYQALYASDIATGVDQSGAIDILGLPDQVVFDSRFWQGVSLNAVFSF